MKRPLTARLTRLAAALAICATSSRAHAVLPTGRTIGIADFGSAAVVENYENLGLGASLPHQTPIVIRNATYDTDDERLRIAEFGPALGTTGFALGANSTIGWLDIKLNQPVNRAGLVVGLDWPWAGSVQFFNLQDILLGEVPAFVDNRIDKGKFVGWEAGPGGLISRLRVNDTFDASHIIAVDDLRTEIIPEPSAFFLAAVCALVAANRRTRKNRDSHVAAPS
ncbi:MAG: hypothetical protein H0T51_25985 [Pirellulales bacterium]|nr:hypothetical protein [Pirellulales bacterium]